jgi:hypothetical protein
VKSLTELVDSSNSTFSLLQDMISRSKNPVEMLPVTSQEASSTLHNLQISTKSMLGVVVYHTGGILVDNGWLRVIGSGSDKLPRDLVRWNSSNEVMLVADDVVGGFFAINGGSLGENVGDIYYLAPDTLAWESLEMGYTDFINWILLGDLNQFYETFRWVGWEKDLKVLDGDKGILIYPYLWSSGVELSKRSRSIVPIEELWCLTLENKRRLS